MHPRLHTVVIGTDPHGGILIHHAAAGVEKVIVVADLCEALGAHAVSVVEGLSAAGHKAGLDELAVCAEVVPAVAAQLRGLRIDGLVDCQLAVILREVVIAVQLIQAIDHLHTVDGEVQLAVLTDDLPFTIDRIGNEHLAVCIEVMHTRLHTVVIGTDPHGGILIHLAVSGIENVVVVTDLREALSVDVVGEVVGAPVNVRKAVLEDVAVRVAPVSACLQFTPVLVGVLIDIAASGGVHQTPCARKDNTVIHVDQAVVHLSVLIAPVLLAAVVQETAAQTRQQTGLLIEVVPRNVHHVIRHGRCIAVRHIALDIQPIGTLLQRHETAEHRFARDEVFGSFLGGAERASYQLSLLVEGIRQALDRLDARIHDKGGGVKIVEVRLAILGHDRLPAGSQRSEACKVMLAVLFKQARQLLVGDPVCAEVIPEFTGFPGGVAGKLLHAGQRSTVPVVAPASILLDPAVLAVLLQGEGIREISDRAEEMGAVVAGQVCTVVVGIQTVLLLEILILRHRLKHMEVCIDVIRQITADRAGELAVFIPSRRVRRDQLQAAEHAEGVGRRRVDRLILADEVADHCQLVVLNLCGGQSEVLVCQTQTGFVDRDALRRSQRDGNCGQRADTLCKLEQEVPRSPALLIAAGQHIQQLRQLFRDGHLGHIHGKGVGDLRSCIGIDQIIRGILRLIVCVGCTAVPCQQAAAAGGMVEIKVRLVIAVEIRCGLRRQLQRLVDGDGLGLDRSFLIGGAVCLSRLVGLSKLRIDRLLECRKLGLKHRTDRQCTQLAFRVGRKGKAGGRTSLGIVKHKLRLGGVELTTLQLTEGGQCDLQIAKRHILGVDLDQIPVVGGLQRQLRRLAVDHVHRVSGKSQLRCLHNVQRLGTQHAAVRSLQLDLHVAQPRCGKHVVLQRANAFIGYCQLGALRQGNGTAGRRNAGDPHLQLRTDGQIIVVRSDDSMVKHVGGLGSRHHHQRRTDRALVAVRRAVGHGDGIRTLRLCCKGRRAAAVQIDRRDTAGIQHDLCNLNVAAACGEGILPAIQRHQDNTSVIGDAHTAARCALGIVVRGVGNGDLTVLDQPNIGANCLLDLALVGIPLLFAADDRRSILEDAEEVLAAHAAILDTLHHKGAGGPAVAHIVEVAVDTHHGAVIGDVAVAVGVGVVLLRRLHLIRHADHLDLRAVVVAVVRIDIHIIAGDVRCGDIVHDLPIVLRLRHLDLLRDAGRQHGGLAGEDLVVGVRHLGACRKVQIIRKRVAAGLPQLGIYAFRYIAALQCANTLIGTVGVIDRRTDVLLCGHAIKAILQEELDPDLICQVLGIVALHDGADGRAAIQLLQDIERIQVAVQVQNAEGMYVRHVMEEVLVIFGADLLRHLLHRAGNAAIGGQLHQIANVAGPASQIRRALDLGVIRHIHSAEHMGEFHGIAVRQCKLAQAAEAAGAGAVRRVLLRHIAGKHLILRAAERRPCTGGILLNAAADIVDHKRHGFLFGMLPHKGACVCFKCCQ